MNAALRSARAGGLRGGIPGIYDPHRNSANEQGIADEGDIFQMLADDFNQQERRDRSNDKRNRDETQGVREYGFVALLAARKSGEEPGNPGAEIEKQRQDRTELDHDGVHLPVAIGETDVQQSLGNTQMRRRTYGERNSVRPSTMPRMSEST